MAVSEKVCHWRTWLLRCTLLLDDYGAIQSDDGKYRVASAQSRKPALYRYDRFTGPSKFLAPQSLHGASDFDSMFSINVCAVSC